jgi:hypothetical protein
MLTIMILTLAITAQDSPERHVRAMEARILALMNTGLSRSATFRRLETTLNESDVIVYIEPKLSVQGRRSDYMAKSIGPPDCLAVHLDCVLGCRERLEQLTTVVQPVDRVCRQLPGAI